ncbi:hypothetical protein BC941DRAFT_410493 [Chlamydoabsidia padenii]|nr:hypothetical protein BC941DRAFT_410493 [Chlamydoabsidia padenii]
MDLSTTNTLYADASFIDKYKLSIELDRNDTLDNVYFAGDCIQGGVRIPYANSLTTASRLDIHLSCTFRPYNDTNKDGRQSTTMKLFKVLVSPCLMVIPNNDYVAFSVPIPLDIPSTMEDKTLPGATTYKIKVIHGMEALPLSLYPKKSIQVTILDRININDPVYQTSLSTEKDLKAVIPKDMTTKNKAGKWINNDSADSVHCRLSIPTTCFREGHNIPISLHVQHIAPVKQMEGIQLQLERIVNFTTATGERSVETLTVSDVTLPLICDVDDYSATVNSHITVPAHTSPTLQTSFSPVQISYRIKATVNLDINNLLEEPAAPSRKRDIAKGMVNSWGKRIGWALDGSTTGILPDSIVELELPFTIGTFDTPSDSIPNDSRSSLRSASSVSLPPKLPTRPASISSPSSCPLIYTSAYYQNNPLASSPTGEKSDWKTVIGPEQGTPSSPSSHRPIAIHQTRSITDPFSLIDYNSNMTCGSQQHPLQQPSAPKLDEIEGSDNKNGYGRSKSTPPQEKHPLYMVDA